MTTIANDRLAITLDFLVDKAIANMQLMENRLNRLGSTMERLATRQVNSMTDAINKSFPKAAEFGIGSMEKAIERTTENMHNMARASSSLNLKDFGIDNVLPTPEKVGKAQKLLDQVSAAGKKVKKVVQGMDQAMLGFGLSILFTGMALKAFAQNVIKSLVNTFMMLADAQNAGVKRTLELQAVMQFLKFTLFDTFANTEMYASFVGFIVNLVRRISEFVQKRPQIAALIGVFLIMGVVLGGVAMVLGQIGLLAVGLQISFLALIGVLALLAVAVTVLFFLWTSDTNDLIKVLGTLLISLTSILTILKIIGITLSLPFIVGLIAVGIFIGALYLLSKATGGIQNAFKAMGVFLLAIFAFIGDAIYNTMILPIRIVIGLINTLIQANNALANTKIGRKAGLKTIDLIQQPANAPLSQKVWEMRNDLLAQGGNQEGGNVVELGEESLNKLGNKLEDKIFSRFNLTPSTDL